MSDTTNGGFRKAMTPVHTWGGLVVGWVLYFVFVTGTLGYFDTEIDSWAKPELPVEDLTLEEAVSVAEPWLAKRAPDADSWFIGLPGSRDYPNLRVSWRYQEPPPDEEKNGHEFLDAKTATPYPVRDTDGGQTLYRMHYNFHYMPRTVAHYLVGVVTMFMLVAIVTGIVIHKKIFKDFFTFRPYKGQRSWLDMHNMLSVLALPFHLMITYSGLLFFAFMYVPGILLATYGNPQAAQEALEDKFFPHEHIERAGEAAPLAPLLPMVETAKTLWGAEQIKSISVEFPGDANARVTINPQSDSVMTRADKTLIFNGVDGKLIERKHFAPETPINVFFAMLGLHEGLFADTALRWLYFVSGVIGSVMIATGLVLWSIKRHARLAKHGQPPGRGHRLVEVLNIGTVVGLLVGIAAFFWANRLLPLELEERHEWELHVLFITWLGMLVFAAVRPASRAWTESLWIAAVAFALIPLLNALTTDRHLINSLAAGDWVFAGFDLCMLVFGLGFAFAAWLRQRRSITPSIVAAAKPAAST